MITRHPASRVAATHSVVGGGPTPTDGGEGGVAETMGRLNTSDVRNGGPKANDL